MAEKRDKNIGHLGTESVRAIAESNGISNLSDDSANRLADDATYRLKQMVQVGVLLIFFVQM